ncbi:hypothetical protein [Deinococcus sp. JMULE3]|jgi:O-antigen/teichoic acid export membrane protein|uniref:hypothetical protein n=1 Tax=Deinococcus sp. JMULE3 TaxID=2518341 RepID=UPI001575780B|nr:hypothetical protein [Deinococcus sp. JMULE3]NTY00472.1 hypothetical protein [Deinococcus sp. JMULE3]
MTLPLLLCTLIALTSGLHFGTRFAQAHRAGLNLLPSVSAHGLIATALIVLTVLLDPTDAGLLWLAVATTSLASLALGALWPTPTTRPVTVPRDLPTSQAA